MDLGNDGRTNEANYHKGFNWSEIAVSLRNPNSRTCVNNIMIAS